MTLKQSAKITCRTTVRPRLQAESTAWFCKIRWQKKLFHRWKSTDGTEKVLNQIVNNPPVKAAKGGRLWRSRVKDTSGTPATRINGSTKRVQWRRWSFRSWRDCAIFSLSFWPNLFRVSYGVPTWGRKAGGLLLDRWLLVCSPPLLWSLKIKTVKTI